jgi:hypothetical protein
MGDLIKKEKKYMYKPTGEASNILLVPVTDEGRTFVKQLRKYMVNNYKITSVYRGPRPDSSSYWGQGSTRRRDVVFKAVYLHNKLGKTVTQGKDMTDKNELRALLTKFGVGFREVITDNILDEIVLEEGMNKVVGYIGFSTSFSFHKDGEFMEVGAYEG